MVDMEMLVVAAGRERTKEEFQRVLSRAGLSLSRIVPLSAGTSLIEALPV
jgi:antitoxin component of RelBE/YafQ-DinJ toxin-antitoxin module